MSSTPIHIRQALLTDVESIIAVDNDRYGKVSDDISHHDVYGMFVKRIENSHGWFWVAEVKGKIEGLLSCLPVASSPDEFVSWDDCTANGTLDGKYAPGSNKLYVVALTTTEKGSELDVADLLLANALAKCVRSRIEVAYFSGRLPGYSKYADSMSAVDYYNSKVEVDGRQQALDHQVRHFESLGLKRLRLVENGFPEDQDSCGYGVLFKMDIPCYGWPFPRLWAAIIGTITKRPKLFAAVAKLA